MGRIRSDRIERGREGKGEEREGYGGESIVEGFSIFFPPPPPPPPPPLPSRIIM